MRTVRAQGLLAAAALLLLPAIAGAQVVINEIRIDGDGGNDQEYFELVGPAGTNLNNYWYITIGDGSGSGTVENVTSLAGTSIGPGGYFLVVDTGSGSLYALGGTPDLDVLLNFENSDNFTHLLVTDFTGAANDDLDTNDDGVLDVTPWTTIVDSVALIETFDVPASGEFYYSATTIGPDGVNVPGTVKRCPSGTGVWAIGPFDTTFGPLLDTPDAANDCPAAEICNDTIDNDADGQTDCADLECVGTPFCSPIPANDLCASPTIVVAGSFPLTTLGASSDGPTGCGGELSNDVWFRFDAPCTGSTTFSLCGTASAGFNPQMAIYDAAGGCPTGPTWLACAAGGCTGSNEPEILFDTVSGQSYYVQIGGFDGTRGDATLTITCPSPDCHVAPNPNFSASYVAEQVFANAPAAGFDGTPTFDSITVSGAGPIQDLDVQLNVTHDWVGDLVVVMISPASTQITLHNAAGGGQFDMDVRFDDEGAPYDSVPFFSGQRMQPFELLGVYDGQAANGAWGISVVDIFTTPSPGVLDSWALHFASALPIPDASPAGALATIDIPASNTDGVIDLDVAVDMSHAAPSQVALSLTSPAGTTVTLHSQGSATGVSGRFDDDPLLGGFNDGYGSLIATGPGELADFDGEFLAGTWTLIAADGVGGTTGSLTGWDLLACPGPCSDVTNIVSSTDCAANTVTLGWTNGETYASIQILRDGALIGTIAGTEQSFVDTSPLEGWHDYTVRALCTVGAREASRSVNHYAYNGESHLVLQLEGLVDGGDPGAIDSGLAIEAALQANGLTGIKRISIDPDAFPCLTSSGVESIWVAAGTYPFNYLISTSEGDILGSANATGIALYLEGADHWGFSHDVSILDGRDGVDDAIHNGPTTDGDDTFTAMDGADSGFGLDLDLLANVGYTQDSAGDDYTDQLLPATADAAGASAAAIWRLDDAIGTPYVTGIHYDTNSGGKTIVQSWEFGGFGGDQDALMAEYIQALLGPGPDGFRRGDCNGDGSMNIADAIFVLAALFSGGPQGTCSDACDINDDGARNIADAVYGLATLFSGGPPPPAPFPACGPDATAGDPLDCASYTPPC